MHKRICNYCYPWQTPTEEISHLALTSWVPTCRAEDTNDPDRMSYTLEWCSCYDEATAEQSPNHLLFMPLIGFFDFTRRLNKTPKKRLHAVTKHYSKWQWMKALWFWQQKYVSQIHWCCSFVIGHNYTRNLLEFNLFSTDNRKTTKWRIMNEESSSY